MSEITPEERQRIIDKWKPVLDYDDSIPRPLSACKVMLIEPHERWCWETSPEYIKTNYANKQRR